jgi:hypothetical protein
VERKTGPKSPSNFVFWRAKARKEKKSVALKANYDKIETSQIPRWRRGTVMVPHTL